MVTLAGAPDWVVIIVSESLTSLLEPDGGSPCIRLRKTFHQCESRYRWKSYSPMLCAVEPTPWLLARPASLVVACALACARLSFTCAKSRSRRKEYLADNGVARPSLCLGGRLCSRSALDFLSPVQNLALAGERD